MRPLACSVLALLVTFTAACAPATFGDYPHAPVRVTPLDSPAGWTHVEEPLWFSASLPAEPKTSFETIGVEDSHVQVKALYASDGASVWTWIRYFEVSSVSTMLDEGTLLRAGKRDFMAIPGVSFVRDEPRKAGEPSLDFVCAVAPRSPLAPTDTPMVARVRAYGHVGTSTRITIVIAVWPESGSDAAARSFFDAFHFAT
jgi:hypothetical protein